MGRHNYSKYTSVWTSRATFARDYDKNKPFSDASATTMCSDFIEVTSVLLLVIWLHYYKCNTIP